MALQRVCSTFSGIWVQLTTSQVTDQLYNCNIMGNRYPYRPIGLWMRTPRKWSDHPELQWNILEATSTHYPFIGNMWWNPLQSSAVRNDTMLQLPRSSAHSHVNLGIVFLEVLYSVFSTSGICGKRNKVVLLRVQTADRTGCPFCGSPAEAQTAAGTNSGSAPAVSTAWPLYHTVGTSTMEQEAEALPIRATMNSWPWAKTPTEWKRHSSAAVCAHLGKLQFLLNVGF